MIRYGNCYTKVYGWKVYEKICKKMISLFLIVFSIFGYFTTSSLLNYSYAEARNGCLRDIDGEVEFVTLAHISHDDVKTICKYWERTNYLISLLGGKYSKAVIVSVLSEATKWQFEDADRGNGVIVRQMVYTGDCSFCGGGGAISFIPA